MAGSAFYYDHKPFTPFLGSFRGRRIGAMEFYRRRRRRMGGVWSEPAGYQMSCVDELMRVTDGPTTAHRPILNSVSPCMEPVGRPGTHYVKMKRGNAMRKL